MLYTTMPLERIYHNFHDNSLKTETNDLSLSRKKIHTKYGNLTVHQEGSHYVIDHFSSTNMEDYLTPKYCPGMTILNEELEKIDLI